MSVRTDVARRALNSLAAGELPLMQSYFADNFVFHSQRDGKPAGRGGLPDRALLLTSSLHEATLSIELVIEDGDLVACRWRGRAVHRGELLGVPASGAPVETTGITIFRFTRRPDQRGVDRVRRPRPAGADRAQQPAGSGLSVGLSPRGKGVGVGLRVGVS